MARAHVDELDVFLDTLATGGSSQPANTNIWHTSLAYRSARIPLLYSTQIIIDRTKEC